MAPRNFLNPVLAKKAAREAARALVLSTKNLGEAHKALTRAAAELEFEYKGLDRDGSLLLYAAAVQQRDNCSTRLALLAAARLAAKNDKAASALLRQLYRRLQNSSQAAKFFKHVPSLAKFARHQRVEAVLSKNGFAVKLRQKLKP